MTEHTVVMPRVAETVDTSYVAEFLVAEGDAVTADQPILKVETDKAVVEIPASRAGTLARWLVELDAEIETGSEIAVIAD